MKITSSITIPVPIYQRWRQYQEQQETKPMLSPLIAQLLDSYLRERECAVSQR